MRHVGFSTGALAKGDFRRGIDLQRSHCDALELSALREGELDALIEALPKLDLAGFAYVSFHAPSRLEKLSERELVERLQRLGEPVSAIIVHPDVIHDFSLWRPLGRRLVLENMDQRKPIARTARELRPYFDALPEARFCFDIGHARQVDPTLGAALVMLRAFGDRLAEIHISEVNAASSHVAISRTTSQSYRRLASLLPDSVPAIIESVIAPAAIADELTIARASLGDLPTEAVLRPQLLRNP
ncbi:MAG: hypothetical protein RIC55_04865 [Pirellulaceae bacterium]